MGLLVLGFLREATKKFETKPMGRRAMKKQFRTQPIFMKSPARGFVRRK